MRGSAALARTERCGARATPSEQPFKYVAEICAAIAKVELLAAGAALVSATASATIAEGRGRIAFSVNFTAVELRPLVLVEQQVVRPGDIREPLGRLGIVFVLVRMQLLGERAIGRFYLLLACALGNTQCLIGIDHYVTFFKSLSCTDWKFPPVFNSTVLFGYNGICNLVVASEAQKQIPN